MTDTIKDARYFPFYLVDKNIIDSYGTRIGPVGIAAYNVIRRYSNGNGEADIPSREFIASKIGASVADVQTAIQTMIDLGIIEGAS